MERTKTTKDTDILDGSIAAFEKDFGTTGLVIEDLVALREREVAGKNRVGILAIVDEAVKGLVDAPVDDGCTCDDDAALDPPPEEETKASEPAAKEPDPEPDPEPVADPVIAPTVGATATGQVLIANQHTGGVTMPRKGRNGIVAKPIRFPPGTVTRVDADEWAVYVKMPMIQAYLDHGIIAVVKRTETGVTAITGNRTSAPAIPEHLQTPEEEEEGAKVIREKAGEISI